MAAADRGGFVGQSFFEMWEEAYSEWVVRRDVMRGLPSYVYQSEDGVWLGRPEVEQYDAAAAHLREVTRDALAAGVELPGRAGDVVLLELPGD